MVKRSEIAAARVQVALAKRRGEEPPPELVHLATMHMTEAEVPEKRE